MEKLKSAFDLMTAVIWYYHGDPYGFEKPVYTTEDEFLNALRSSVECGFPAEDMAKSCIWVKDEAMANKAIAILEPAYGENRARVFQLTQDNYHYFA